MLKKLLFIGALLVPLGAQAQVFEMIRLMGMVGAAAMAPPRAGEVNAPYSLDWPPAINSKQARADQLEPVKQQATRGVSALSQRIKAHPDSADLYLRRGLLYAQLGKKRAADDLERVVTLSLPAPPRELAIQVAQGYLDADMPAQVQSYATDYLRLAPSDPRPYRLRALAEMRLSKGDHAEHCRAALPDLDRALALDSADFTTRMLRGYALATTKQFVPAIADYRRALAIAPDNAQAHFFMAEALLEAGTYPQVCEHLSLATPFAPETVKWYTKKHCH